MWGSEKDYEDFMQILSPKVELRARQIALTKGKDPDELLVDLGPQWYLYVDDARRNSGPLNESDEKDKNIQILLDELLLQSLTEKAKTSSFITYNCAAERIRRLLQQNETLKQENEFLWEEVRRIKKSNNPG
jgi:hypothetical protein